jgi:alanyl-tRNA synthetase
VYTEIGERVGVTIFTGYGELHTPSEVVAMVAEGQSVGRAEQGDEVELILAATPFYPESGGQVGDTGTIRGDHGVAHVLDTQRPLASLIVHRVTMLEGSIAVGDVVEAEVDAERRLHILPHHSGTHLVHRALQEVLGPEATQAGSLVAPDRLRFDFRWPKPLTADELREVQDCVNAAIWANLPVRAEYMSYDEAMQEGAMALFGEKYGDRVRVVKIGDWSKELCGGTHVGATGDIGLLLITSETGIGSGIRRIEALAGAAAYSHIIDLREYLNELATSLESKPDQLLLRARQLSVELRDANKRIDALTQKLAAREADQLVSAGSAFDGIVIVADQIAAETDDLLKATTDAVKLRLERGAVVLGSIVAGSPRFAMAVTRDLLEDGVQANQILRAAAQQAGGGAGGSPEFAQGGGRDASKIANVLDTAVALIKQKAKG